MHLETKYFTGEVLAYQNKICPRLPDRSLKEGSRSRVNAVFT
ncbi:hypothetical protein [Microbacterium sp.]|jgi:hypothetical protein